MPCARLARSSHGVHGSWASSRGRSPPPSTPSNGWGRTPSTSAPNGPGGVRTGLQDQEFELRLRARRLAQHADEQDAVSAPDGGGLGGGRGGWSTPGQLLRDLPHGADSVL